MQRPSVRTTFPLIAAMPQNLKLPPPLFSFFFQAKLPPGANRILFVKNLNYQITGDDLYDLFGRYGSIRQVRIGNESKTKGTAFVVFDDVMDVRSVASSFLPPPLCFLVPSG